MSKRLKFNKTLGRKRKIKLKKIRSNDKRNMPNKLNLLSNSHTKTKNKISPKIYTKSNQKNSEEVDIDKPFEIFECFENNEENYDSNSLRSFQVINLQEIQNSQVNDLILESSEFLWKPSQRYDEIKLHL